MKGYINGFDWLNVDAMKYWSFPASTSDEVKKSTVKNAIFSGEYLGCLKIDGYYQRILKDDDGNIFMIARSRNVHGEIVDKHEWLPHMNPWFDSLPNGTCLLCECYWPGNEGSKNITSILGCLKEKAIARQKNNPLHLYAFDIMALNGENYNKTKYADRLNYLAACEKNFPGQYVEYAKPYEGQELWMHLQDYLASGREGMVIMRKDAIVYNKRTPARISIKVKKEIRETIDCFFTGRTSAATREYTGKEIAGWTYWYDTFSNERLEGVYYKDYVAGRTIIPVTKGFFYKWAGSLEIGVYDKDGKVFPIGWLSGITEEMKAHPQEQQGKCIEVSAMEYDLSKGFSLRHGKMIGFRQDLCANDCTLEKILGEI